MEFELKNGCTLRLTPEYLGHSASAEITSPDGEHGYLIRLDDEFRIIQLFKVMEEWLK